MVRKMDTIKIMIVEDELVIGILIGDFLAQQGFRVLDPVMDFESAVECLEKEEPDIAVLDIKLRGKKTGIDIASYIKTNQNIPFIFLTSNMDKATVDEAIQLAPVAYLLKPFNKNELKKAVEMAMQRHHST